MLDGASTHLKTIDLSIGGVNPNKNNIKNAKKNYAEPNLFQNFEKIQLSRFQLSKMSQFLNF